MLDFFGYDALHVHYREITAQWAKWVTCMPLGFIIRLLTSEHWWKTQIETSVSFSVSELVLIFFTDGSEEAEEKASGSKSKAPKQVSSMELQELAEGDEDMVEDLELSDQDWWPRRLGKQFVMMQARILWWKWKLLNWFVNLALCTGQMVIHLSQVSLFYSQVQDMFVNCIVQFENSLVQYEHLYECFSILLLSAMYYMLS